MKKRLVLCVWAVITVLGLIACSTDPGDDGTSVGATVAADDQVTVVRLSDDYDNALSASGQLALGTLRIEDTDLAVTESQAAELLPLWQALQSLANSDTTASAELDAVANQIQDSMTVEQVTAIADMRLTEESLTTMLENGDLAFGRGNFGQAGDDGTVGVPGRGFAGGGFPGGGPGEGFPGGGPGGAGFGSFNEDDIATRQAQFAAGDLGAFQERALTGAVVRLLQTKTGEAPELAGIFATVFAVASEVTGLSVEEIQAQTAEGATLAEVVEAHGGDVQTVRTALVEALSELPNAADLDVEQLADDWLGQ